MAEVARALGIPARFHTAAGAYTDTMHAAELAGAELVLHRPGYVSVLRARARVDALERGWLEIPFGMECQAGLDAISAQTRGTDWAGVRRIVLAVGSGMALAGVLDGLTALGLDLPVLGVTVGMDPRPRLHRWAPGWESRVTLVPSTLAYAQQAPACDLAGLELDATYEAKCLPFLTAGDLLWVVGGPAQGSD